MAGGEHELLQKNKPILHMGNQAPNLCEQGMLQPPAGPAAGMPLPEEAGSAAGKLIRLGERSFAPKPGKKQEPACWESPASRGLPFETNWFSTGTAVLCLGKLIAGSQPCDEQLTPRSFTHV